MKNDKNILKWLNNELSDDELKQFKKTEDYKSFQKIAHYSAQIDVPKVDITKALEDFNSKKKAKLKKGKVIKFNFNKLYKYAAAILIVITTSYFLFLSNETSFKTNLAETKTFKLPDNSEVVLNANSKISFSKNDWATNRNLKLEGEAFFKVEKGQKFTVQTAIGNVSVLGTQFNVKERKNYFEVKTYEGLVSVAYQDTLIKLQKGTLFKVVNNIIDIKSTFDINEKFWLENESNFKSTPLLFVLQEIENQFDYKIETNNINLEQLYSGGFTHKDINIAMQSITIPLQLSYKIEGKKITVFNYDE